jgi:hypothetical protein
MRWALTVYAVLTFALGHGKRLPFYSDYSVWNTRLVPIGNANWDCTDREARAGAGNHFSRLMHQKEKAGTKENPDCRDDDEPKREEVQQDPDGFATRKDFRTKWFRLQLSPELRRGQRAIGAVFNHPPILGGFSCRSEKFSHSTPTPVAKPQLLHRRANSHPRK